MPLPEIITIEPLAAEQILDAAMERGDGYRSLLESEVTAANAVDDALAIAKLFPDEVIKRTREYSQAWNSAGMLVLRGLTPPPEMLQSRPDENGNLRNTKAEKTAGLIALAAASLVGAPITYVTNPRGHLQPLITQVTPMEHNPYTTPQMRGNVRTAKDTGWHAEAGAIQPSKRIEFLSLYCVQSQPEVATQVMPGHAVDRQLDLKDRLAMREHQFVLAEPIVPGSERNRRPLITDTKRGPRITYSPIYDSQPSTSEDGYTLAHLAKLEAAIERASDQVTAHVPEVGDVVLCDNNGLHNRDRFEPRLPYPRRLLRVFAGSPDQDLFVDPSER
jgi:hypothetical protein